MELHPIKTEQDYDTALRAIEALWSAPAGPAGGRATGDSRHPRRSLRGAHHPIDPPIPLTP